LARLLNVNNVLWSHFTVEVGTAIMMKHLGKTSDEYKKAAHKVSY
jgi:hypothetical protein